MDDGILHISLILRHLLTFFQICLRPFLQGKGKISASIYALPANSQTAIHLFQTFLNIIKAVHTAAGAFKVHDVEFFVQEGIEANLSVFHPHV